ncbi:unnamed protein product [Notodromas monacha]|uniref:Uncharacterized protein n=1 Tax=Notodromas monacha TaxID=399045 RepID=A0A7R9BV58_9CRUS|nr:unnamed protein product [Notodromas monacha]CAG0920983.1 unnamed protein product [Notodromas monacha]
MLWYGCCEADVEDMSSVQMEGDCGGVEDYGTLRASEDGILPIGGVWCDMPEVRVIELEDNGPWCGMVLDFLMIVDRNLEITLSKTKRSANHKMSDDLRCCGVLESVLENWFPRLSLRCGGNVWVLSGDL